MTADEHRQKAESLQDTAFAIIESRVDQFPSFDHIAAQHRRAQLYIDLAESHLKAAALADTDSEVVVSDSLADVEFLQALTALVDYWAKGRQGHPLRPLLQSFTHSVLAHLDENYEIRNRDGVPLGPALHEIWYLVSGVATEKA